MFGDEQIVTKSAAKQIAEHIRSAITHGKLKGHERLPAEEELAARFGVSRPTIREALKRLAAQNLISSKRGPSGGTFVNSLRLQDLAENVTTAATMLVSVGGIDMEEIAEARILLEGLCCRIAVERANEAVLASLRETLNRQRNPALTDEEFCASDVQFHRSIVDATGNTMLRFVMYALIESLVPVTNMVIVYVRDRSAIIGHHERMLAAIEKRDTDEACQHLKSLIGYLSESYTKAKQQRGRREQRRQADGK